MDTIIRNVESLDSADRQAIEHLLGQPLQERQQVMIQVRNADTPRNGVEQPAADGLPDWCDVYAGLTDSELSDVERTVLQRSDFTRSAE